MPAEYYVAWWNLENLFDEENAPPDRPTEKVFRTISNDIVGWTPQLRDRKVAQLASVIAQMNGAAGPDFLGICEVENRFVIDLLVQAMSAFSPPPLGETTLTGQLATDLAPTLAANWQHA